MSDPPPIRRVPINSLVPDPANPRTHGEENIATLVACLQKYGQVEPLVVQAGTRRIIAGHGRAEAMKQLGWTECNVQEIDVDDVTCTALGIALNRTAELAGWDPSVLPRLLDELRTQGKLDGVGFSPDRVDELLAEMEARFGTGDVDEDKPPLPADKAITKKGDLHILDNHRLLCGDSGSSKDVDRLIGGKPIHMVNTDPPYNCRVEPRSNNAIAASLGSSSPFRDHTFRPIHYGFSPHSKKPTGPMRPKDRRLAGDFKTDEEFDQCLLAWFGNAGRVLLPGRAFYIWGGYANLGNYPPALKASGLYFAQGIVWNKLHPVYTRKDLMGAYEFCFYGWKEGAGHLFYGPNNARDLWEIKKVPSQMTEHMTEKPVELAVRAITYSSKRGENVLDLFGGSGSTLMGCEHTGRRAFMMEADEIYTDVIVRRWQKATGKDATLEATGQTFAEVARERGKDAGGP